MARSFDEKSAAIPRRRFRVVGLELSRLEVQRVPDQHRSANVERERQLICDDRVVRGRDRLEVGANREHVIARHFRVTGKRHRRIEQRSVPPLPLPHGGVEIGVAPCADSRLGVRRDVRRQNVAERRFDRPAAREGRAARRGMARTAIGSHGEIAAALDLGEILPVGPAHRGVAGRRSIEPDQVDAADDERQNNQSAERHDEAPKHGPAAPDSSDIGFGSHRPTRRRAPKACPSDCSRHSGESRSRPSQTNSGRPNSGDSG